MRARRPVPSSDASDEPRVVPVSVTGHFPNSFCGVKQRTMQFLRHFVTSPTRTGQAPGFTSTPIFQQARCLSTKSAPELAICVDLFEGSCVGRVTETKARRNWGTMCYKPAQNMHILRFNPVEQMRREQQPPACASRIFPTLLSGSYEKLR